MRPSNSRKHNFSGWSFLPTIVYRLQQSSVDMWHESFCWCWSEKTANAPMENLQRCLQPANVTRGRLAGCSIFPRMRWWCLFWYKKCTPGGIRTHGLSLRRRSLYPTELRVHALIYKEFSDFFESFTEPILLTSANTFPSTHGYRRFFGPGPMLANLTEKINFRPDSCSGKNRFRSAGYRRQSS